MIKLRKPVFDDGPKVCQLARSVGGLDVNSCYHYLLMCRKFADTCVVATHESEPIGFLIGFQDPNNSQVLFIWQIAVSGKFRHQGIGTTMLYYILLDGSNAEIQFIETTITPSNKASQALFRNFARDFQSEIEIKEQEYFASDLFPDNDHEAEILFRIGPLNSNLKKQLNYEYI